ncbi:MAG: dihydrofolate reductase family protein [Chloroflexota bacterium]
MRVNVAMTADGKIDSIARRGALISSPQDLTRVDRLRAECDAVLVGGRTLLDQDPHLTLKSPTLRAERLAKGLPEHPAKVGVVSLAGVRTDGRFLTDGPARRLIYTTARTSPEQIARLRATGAEVYVAGETRVDLLAALASLAELGIRRLLVEGGGTILAEFFRLGLVDEVTAYIAPAIFGGASAPSPADGPGLPPEAVIRLRLVSVERFDETGGILVHYTIAPRE